LDALAPGVVDLANVHCGNVNDSMMMANASLAVSAARRLGAVVFCAPEDIVTVRPHMILAFIASALAVRT